MSLETNLLEAFVLLGAIFLLGQLIFYAKRVYDSDKLHRQTMNRDRQGNVYTLPDSSSGNRYGDIFFIEPNSDEAARVRAQLEKDDKDLPSYDEVMRMCNLTSPTAAAVPPPLSADNVNSSSLAITALPAPPYTESDINLHASPPTHTEVVVPIEAEASTSRSVSTTTHTVISLPNTASNTIV